LELTWTPIPGDAITGCAAALTSYTPMPSYYGTCTPGANGFSTTVTWGGPGRSRASFPATR
jgi:hypothetical protein